MKKISIENKMDDQLVMSQLPKEKMTAREHNCQVLYELTHSEPEIGIDIDYIPVVLPDNLKIHKRLDKSNKKILHSSKKEKRFNLWMRPFLLDYVRKQAKKEGITASKFIRNLIEIKYKKTATT